MFSRKDTSPCKVIAEPHCEKINRKKSVKIETDELDQEREKPTYEVEEDEKEDAKEDLGNEKD